MARYLNDQNRIVFIWESGTYAATSGGSFSFGGLVQNYDITENENVIQTRFIGQGNRNVGMFQTGPLDIEGTITMFPQDWKLLALTIGSIGSGATAANFFNNITEINGGQRFSPWTSGFFNPWTSFSIEENRTGPIANQNSVRTIRGCVPNSYTLTISQGEPIEAEIGFIGQIGSWFSGTAATATIGSIRPYLWSDVIWSLPGGTTQESVKNLVFTINNNFVGPHYLNGSRTIQVPYPENRDYTIEVTQDLDSVMVGSLWDAFFKGGSLFNATLDINSSNATAGSHRLFLTFSGCRIIEMEMPTQNEGISETTYTIIPGSVAGSAWDRYPYTFF